MSSWKAVTLTAAQGSEGTGIRRAAVIGAGSMGAGIAAQFANAGIPVDLLDIPGAPGRSGPASNGVARQAEIDGFMGKAAQALVRSGNTEDDLSRLAEADWIVEAIIENLMIKKDLYRRIETVRKPGTMVSSNTSTIPRAELVADMPTGFAEDFAITHFFNPPRVMQLVEIVGGPENAPAMLARLADANRFVLGKSVVTCRDTPGFIANRIGCTWIAVAILEAIRLGLTVEEADAVNAALGIPKTGVFGLMDLIGIDLIPHVWGSMHSALASDDGLQGFNLPACSLICDMIAHGDLGRKSGKGFYRRDKDKSRWSLDLQTGDYRPEIAATHVPGPKELAKLLDDSTRIGDYARSLVARIIGYTAIHADQIADDVAAIDTAMVLGYSWKYGPFALADLIGRDRAEALIRDSGQELSPIFALAQAHGGFYGPTGPLATTGGAAKAMAAASIVSKGAVLLENKDARLVDLGDDVACFQITTKMNSFAPGVLDLLEQTLDRAEADRRALVIGNEDARAFSSGADLGYLLGLLEAGDEARLTEYLKTGQRLFLRMKYLPVPVVAAVHGITLGGGCEIALHADTIVAHSETRMGLPEVRVGIIPGWGGTTQMLLRSFANSQIRGPIGHAGAAFDTILAGFVSGSALEAKEAGYLRPDDQIVMHRSQLLDCAKEKAIALREGYVAPEPSVLPAMGLSGLRGLLAPISVTQQAGRMTATDYRIAEALATVLAGGTAAVGPALAEAEMMALELQVNAALMRSTETRDRMAHMLRTGKALRN